MTVTIEVGPEWVHARPYNAVPQFALWWEDANGAFIDTLFVTRKAAKDEWMLSGGSRRPYSLPVWSHHRGVKNEDGGVMPSKKMPLPDALTAASPRAGRQAVIAAGFAPPPDKLYLYLEINHSNDWNAFYPEQAPSGAANYPADNGQPSLVYRAEADFSRGGAYDFTPVGTGDVRGENGLIEANNSRLTSAMKIVQRVTVEVK